MSDPVGAAVSRFWQGNPATQGQGIHDTGARQVPVFGAQDSGGSFADTLTRAISGVSDQQDNAAATVQSFLRGDNVELHQVMAATEEAQISLEMLVELRNKFTDAYKTLTSMQS